MESELYRTTDLYKKTLDCLYDGVYVTDTRRIIIYWNRAAEQLTGYTAAEVTGHRCADNILVHVDDRGTCLCENACPLAETLLDGEMREADVFLHHKEGHRVPVSIRVSPITDARGVVMGAVEVFSDNSEKLTAMEMAALFHDMSLTDDLTHVGNRRLSEISLLAKLDEMQEKGWLFGAALLGMDNLEAVNDRYGPGSGDLMLQVTARTVKGSLRSFDFIGRWGGGEFLLLFSNVRTEEDLLRLAERCRVLVQASHFLSPGGEWVYPTACLGATLSLPGDTMEPLTERLFRALTTAKKTAGRNSVVLL
ncbi:sensor domain-containing diguanylate cyclase [Aminiphilus sp.]|jgi:diguanylate cyclase (GGDEF)-like protein/PAS domain S-box-containing protein|uniref:sensor domain-containing diguanylate cyclase n=1 Tax=Aminiphilus sp. TaxID=1872488 RepID=UPI00260C05B4|nr:sensor domain-containing diguanylate cyclase [Aminiphilus sp.]